MAAGAYKARYAELGESLQERLAEQLATKDAELAARDEEHCQLMEMQVQRHRAQLRQRDEQHAFAIRFQACTLTQTAADELQHAAHAHERVLAARAKRAATWSKKRNNMSRSLKRAAAARDAYAADLQAMDADNTALNAELGQSVKVAEQRHSKSARGVFTFQTIDRDLKVRQHSLNSGASHVREITQAISEHASADGRSLGLESGSLSTVLRWEKRADVLCILHEGRMLRNTIRAAPETQMWWYMDLSPDCRAIEQFGAGFEYATVEYLSADTDSPSPFTGERLSGTPLMSNALVRFGVDGCPIITETCHRTFTPMLEAVGPKYTSTIDCFSCGLCSSTA